MLFTIFNPRTYRDELNNKENELLIRWDKLQNLPRKKKKREKKDILLSWGINEYIKKNYYNI